ncbi:response regulator transcription factor [Kocuria atrinae]|uniref:Response regulator transcription factor n=1 Tax=Kocuria atrinae TaxID=592377 RepID=A0ABN2XVW8_9MICC
MTIRLALVDDQEMIRMGMSMALSAHEDLDVVAEARNGREALTVLETTPVDVVLMDIRMPEMDGVEATRQIQERFGSGAGIEAPRVLILTTFDLDEYAYDALQAGASGFLLKDCPMEELVAAIRHVNRGDAVISPVMTKRLLGHFTPPRGTEMRADARIQRLTPRELEVLQHMAKGLSNAEIAVELVLSEGTVKVHVGHVLDKLQVRDRVQAVVVAYETGVVGI